MQDVPSIGQLCDKDAKRDAIHIAVAPIVAASMLVPNEPVVLNEEGEAVSAEYDEAIGVVDPFLQGVREVVNPGETFWLFLKPNTITGLRHVWSHPAFKIRSPK